MDLRAYKLERIESNFKTSLNAAGRQFKASAGEFPGVVRLTSVNTSGYWYKENVSKQKIALHATAGVLHGDLWQLSQQNNHVSVAYVVARDGTVYQLFPDEQWSYHLGGSSSAPNTQWSKHSVAIEVSNLLGLKPDATNPNILLDTYNKPYCMLTDTQFYTKLAKPYRGFWYWASFTDAQYTALDGLVRNLCDKFKLPLTKLPLEKAYDYYTAVPDTTIFFHTNVRKDKLDFSPSFDFSRIGVPVAPPVPAPVVAPTKPEFFAIKPGDTFYSLAKILNTTVAALEAANPGIDPTKLQVGQQIRFP